ncbi:MAG: sugar phosphate isomerase/epimerase family protein [Thermoprotei archaeon]
MKAGINAWVFGRLPLEEKLNAAKQLGFEGIELNFGDDVDEKAKVEPPSGLSLPSLCTGLFWKYPLNSPDEGIRKKGIEIGLQMVRLASELGARTVLVVPGVNYQEADYRKTLQVSSSSLKEIGKLAKDVGVKVGIEEVWNKMLYSPIEFADFIKALGDSFGAYFDVGNVMEIGYPVQWARELSGIIVGVHFKDYNLDRRQFVPLLQGDVPWKEVVNALASYQGFAIAELSQYKGDKLQAARDAASAMKTILSL